MVLSPYVPASYVSDEGKDNCLFRRPPTGSVDTNELFFRSAITVSHGPSNGFSPKPDTEQIEVEDLGGSEKQLEEVTLPSVKEERQSFSRSESYRGLLTAISDLLTPR